MLPNNSQKNNPSQAFDGIVNSSVLNSLNIPPDVTGAQTNPLPQTSTANYVIKIGDTTKSTLDGMNDYVTLFAYKESIFRGINPHALGQIFSSGAILASHVAICIPAVLENVDLQTKLYNGVKTDEVIIRKIENIQETNIVTMENKYEVCHITAYMPNGEQTWFVFRFDKRTQTITQYDQEGQKQGQNSSFLDLTTSKATPPQQDEGDGEGE